MRQGWAARAEADRARQKKKLAYAQAGAAYYARVDKDKFHNARAATKERISGLQGAADN